MEELGAFKIYRPKDVQKALGISRSAYYEIIEAGLLPYTRLRPGGDRVHLPEHIEQYKKYLREQTKGGERLKSK